MIHNLLNIGASYFIIQKPGDSRPTSDLPAPSQMQSSPRNRVVKDTIELSPAARQTLEQRHEARKAEQDQLTDEILDKGFRVWAQDKHREKIEAEVRAQVLASMGLTEEDFTTLEAEIQQRIQDIIEGKIREKMTEEMTKDLKASGNDIGAAFL